MYTDEINKEIEIKINVLHIQILSLQNLAYESTGEYPFQKVIDALELAEEEFNELIESQSE